MQVMVASAPVQSQPLPAEPVLPAVIGDGSVMVTVSFPAGDGLGDADADGEALADGVPPGVSYPPAGRCAGATVLPVGAVVGSGGPGAGCGVAGSAGCGVAVPLGAAVGSASGISPSPSPPPPPPAGLLIVIGSAELVSPTDSVPVLSFGGVTRYGGCAGAGWCFVGGAGWCCVVVGPAVGCWVAGGAPAAGLLAADRRAGRRAARRAASRRRAAGATAGRRAGGEQQADDHGDGDRGAATDRGVARADLRPQALEPEQHAVPGVLEPHDDAGAGDRGGLAGAAQAEIGRPGRTGDDRGDQLAQAGVDLAQFGVEQGALGAGGEVLVDLVPLAPGQPVPDPGTEPFGRPAAGGVGLPGDVFLQVHLLEAFPGPVREGGDAVRGQPEQRRHVGRALALDLGVPQHRLPAFRQPAERAGGEAAFQPLAGGVGERNARLVLPDVVGDGQPPVPAHLVVEQVAQAGQQVGAERLGRAVPGPQRRQHLRERLGDQVVDRRGVPDQRSGEALGGVDVAQVQQAERDRVPVAGGRDQFGVAAFDRGRRGRPRIG
ncbi:hypothetical protein Athai_49860 [Actinocatenispora thailandica]|uniref:Uncharacterized protein n=1 Tax=Actinocatenispora thailandica TaxID=227318 RepID=A0A7R7DTE9_9ACTN|nr:hypothetical protein Athai_49860 [Actinocatenispora thailandica]